VDLTWQYLGAMDLGAEVGAMDLDADLGAMDLGADLRAAAEAPPGQPGLVPGLRLRRHARDQLVFISFGNMQVTSSGDMQVTSSYLSGTDVVTPWSPHGS
jgi:hypothetical protein